MGRRCFINQNGFVILIHTRTLNYCWSYIRKHTFLLGSLPTLISTEDSCCFFSSKLVVAFSQEPQNSQNSFSFLLHKFHIQTYVVNPYKFSCTYRTTLRNIEHTLYFKKNPRIFAWRDQLMMKEKIPYGMIRGGGKRGEVDFRQSHLPEVRRKTL